MVRLVQLMRSADYMSSVVGARSRTRAGSIRFFVPEEGELIMPYYAMTDVGGTTRSVFLTIAGSFDLR